MSWTQLQIKAARERVPEMETLLEDLGALSVTFTDSQDVPVLEPGVGETPLWPDVTLTGLFPGDVDCDILLLNLEKGMPANSKVDASISHLKERNWEAYALADLEPMQLGERLWIVPCNRPVPEGADIVVHLDPGLAFGSGSHPTTQLCLSWLDSLDLDGANVVDYGCGSGILGIAAAALGARHAWCVDNDPQALISTRNNAANNAVSDQITTFTIRESLPGKAEVVVANILAGTLLELASMLADVTCEGGRIALSGIMSHQAEEVQHGYRSWFDQIQVHYQEEWALISGIRNSTAVKS